MSILGRFNIDNGILTFLLRKMVDLTYSMLITPPFECQRL